MQSILEQITDWLKSMIISGIMGNLSGMFDSVNQQVGQIAGDVGTTPVNFSPAVLRQQDVIEEFKYSRHVRFKAPLTVWMDGKKQTSVVTY